METINDSTYTYNGQTWSGKYGGIKAGEMMMVTLSKDDTLPVIGSPVNPEEYPITIEPGGGNWIGVPCDSYMTLDDAFAGLAPEENDIVKSQTAFAYYENGKWEGELEAIEPGKGYMYTSMANETKHFTFPFVTSTAGIGQWEGKAGIAANFKYGNNMLLICSVHDQFDLPQKVAGIQAYDGSGELRGITARCFRDSIYFIVISGENDGEAIHIRTSMDGSNNTASIGHRSGADEEVILPFGKNKILGKPKNPFVLQIGSTNGISEFYRDANSRLTVYNTLGNCLYSGRASDFDRRKLPANVIYIISEETPDGRIITYKRMNK